MNVHSSFIYNHRQLETAQTSVNYVVYPHNEILFNNKNGYNNLDGSQRHYAKWKKLVSIDSQLYESIYVTSLKRQKCVMEKQISDFQRLGMGLGLIMKEQHQGNLGGHGAVLPSGCDGDGYTNLWIC